MPIAKIFDDSDLQELINNNAVPRFKERNKALILGASYWGLTRVELCLLTLGCLMSESGKWYRKWVLPAEFSYNNEARELHTAEHVLPVLDNYVEWLKSNDVGESNISTYRKLDPEMKIFVNDKMEKFALTKRTARTPKGAVSYQPRSMDDKLKGFIANTSIKGATPSTFRDSWVKQMYENGCKYNELKAISGYKTKSTLDAKIRPQEQDLEQVFNAVFSRVNL
jgi:integrase